MEFAALYIGPGLAPHIQLCLKSWVDYGHSIDLYTYDSSLVLPSGVSRRDANEIIPSSKIYTYQSGMGRGSVSAFSNEFRYRVCQSRPVIWVDTDVLCLRGDWPEREYYFAWQNASRDECNIAVFGAPPHSELIRASLERISTVDVTKAQFGQLGPVPFTATLRALGLENEAGEYHEYYPIGFHECEYFLDPDLKTEAEAKMQNSYAVHLWNEIWTRSRIPTFLRPPEGSWLEAAYERHGIAMPIEARVSNLRALNFVDPNDVVPRGDYEALELWATSLESELLGLRNWAKDLESQLVAHNEHARPQGRFERLAQRWSQRGQRTTDVPRNAS